jgi:hypothetical protein
LVTTFCRSCKTRETVQKNSIFFMLSPFQRSKLLNSHFFDGQNVTRPPLP